MRGISGGGEKGQKGGENWATVLSMHSGETVLSSFSSSFPSIAIPRRYSIPSFGSNQLRQLSSAQNRFGTTRYRSSRNGAAVILHLQDPMVVHIQMYVYMCTYLWPELTFAYQEQKSDNASATFLFSLE